MLGNFFGRQPGRRGGGPVDDPFSLSPFGGAQDPFAGMMGGFMQQQQAHGGAGSCSFTSCCYSSSTGPDGRTIEYSSTTTGGRQGQAPLVSETQQQYVDSDGLEKLGVARRIGERYDARSRAWASAPCGCALTRPSRDPAHASRAFPHPAAAPSRGRSIVAERRGNGEEQKVQTLQHLQEDEASAFDQEWQQQAERVRMPRAAQVATSFRPQLTHEGRGAPPSPSRPALAGPRRESGRRREQLIGPR